MCFTFFIIYEGAPIFKYWSGIKVNRKKNIHVIELLNELKFIEKRNKNEC